MTTMTTLRELNQSAIPQDLRDVIEDCLEEFLEVALLVENMTPERRWDTREVEGA